MIVTCPHCGERFDPVKLAESQDVVEFFSILGRFGDDRRPLVLAFLRCFRKAGSAQSLSKQLRILKEIAAIIRAGELAYDRKRGAVTYGMVLEAMSETVRLKELAGLANTNYFKEILMTMAQKADARAEAAREMRRRTGADRPPKTAGPEDPLDRPVDPERVRLDVARIVGGEATANTASCGECAHYGRADRPCLDIPGRGDAPHRRACGKFAKREAADG